MPLSLDVSGLVDGTNANAADVLTPFNQTETFVNGLETALAAEITARTSGDDNLKNGITAFNQLNVGVPGSTLGIVDGAITITKSRHVIDTEGLGATDDLTTISGFVPGDILILQIVSSARPVTIKHNLNNIFNYTQTDVLLDQPGKLYVALYDAVTGKWCQLTAAQQALLLHSFSAPSVNTPVAQLTVPDRVLVTAGTNAPRLEVAPSQMVGNRVEVRASGTTIQAMGAVIAHNSAGSTVAANNQSDTSYSSLTTGITLGQAAGWASTFDLTRRQYDPMMELIIRMPTTLSLGRWFFGFMSQLPGNADDPTGSFIGFRYLPGDTGFKAILDDGSSLGVSTDLNTVSADETYRLRIRVDGAGGGQAYFSIDEGSEFPFATGMPGAATNLGFGAYVYTNTGGSRAFSFARAVITWK